MIINNFSNIKEEIKANDVNSESATEGQVLTANGQGGSSWQNGGGSETTYTLRQILQTTPNSIEYYSFNLAIEGEQPYIEISTPNFWVFPFGNLTFHVYDDQTMDWIRLYIKTKAPYNSVFFDHDESSSDYELYFDSKIMEMCIAGDSWDNSALHVEYNYFNKNDWATAYVDYSVGGFEPDTDFYLTDIEHPGEPLCETTIYSLEEEFRGHFNGSYLASRSLSILDLEIIPKLYIEIGTTLHEIDLSLQDLATIFNCHAKLPNRTVINAGC